MYDTTVSLAERVSLLLADAAEHGRLAARAERYDDMHHHLVVARQLLDVALPLQSELARRVGVR